MITRLEVDGFKSLRGFAIDLAPFTALIGPNSAGKSNILEALALLSHLTSEPVEAAFKHGRGRAIDQFTLEKGEPVREIRFVVELLLPVDVAAGDGETTNRVRYELAVTRERRGSGAETLVIENERLVTIEAEHDKAGRQYPALVGRLHHATRTIELLAHLPQTRNDIRKGRRRVQLSEDERVHFSPDTQTALAAMQGNSMVHQFSVPVELLKKVRQRATALHISTNDAITQAMLLWLSQRSASPPEPMHRAPVSAHSAIARMLSGLRVVHLDAARLHDESERIGGAVLAPDASNLPTVLAALSPRRLGEIRADLVTLVPGISTLEVVAGKDTFRIEIELSGGERLPARLVSDGTLRALALLTALRSRPAPSILAVEEPENGIYPGRLRTLLDLLREAALESSVQAKEGENEAPGEEQDEAPAPAPQVIITSHSPVVLAATREDVGALRFIDTVRRDGHLVTRARPVGPATPGDRGQHSVPLREVDALLSLATSEAAE